MVCGEMIRGPPPHEIHGSEQQVGRQQPGTSDGYRKASRRKHQWWSLGSSGSRLVESEGAGRRKEAQYIVCMLVFNGRCQRAPPSAAPLTRTCKTDDDDDDDDESCHSLSHSCGGGMMSSSRTCAACPLDSCVSTKLVGPKQTWDAMQNPPSLPFRLQSVQGRASNEGVADRDD
mmetsp:Transcript_15174/g.32720  ORF Transcript_15174/g.32720 Transcript_15174/m.32720 type:complete len:174 (-) Transcript_15174:59-580(-)